MLSARILCIEDEREMVELMRLLLTRRGYEFLGARGGNEGLQIALDQQPDLILLDIMMPDMNGWHVYHRLKHDDRTARIPVIVVTANAKSDEQLTALREAKVDDYITKPFGPTQLLDSIERSLTRRQKR